MFKISVFCIFGDFFLKQKQMPITKEKDLNRQEWTLVDSLGFRYLWRAMNRYDMFFLDMI